MNAICRMVAICVAFQFSALHAGTITSKIKAVTCSKSLNACRIVLENPVPGTGCQYADYVAWRPSDSMSRDFLAIALAAQAAKKKVEVTANSPCILDSQPSLDAIVVFDSL